MRGFTLIELIIVLFIMGTLAVIVIPMVTSTTEEAKLNTLKSNLAIMRRAVQLYYVQHNNTYPGVKRPNGGVAADQTQARDGFRCQLCRYSSVDGVCSSTKDATHKFGPYMKQLGLPENPYNGLKNILMDLTTTDVMARTSSGTRGWKFYTKTGVLIADDGGHDDL